MVLLTLPIALCYGSSKFRWLHSYIGGNNEPAAFVWELFFCQHLDISFHIPGPIYIFSGTTNVAIKRVEKTFWYVTFGGRRSKYFLRYLNLFFFFFFSSVTDDKVYVSVEYKRCDDLVSDSLHLPFVFLFYFKNFAYQASTRLVHMNFNPNCSLVSLYAKLEPVFI